MDRQPTFFRPGGTLEPGAQSYIVRAADQQLVDALLRGEYVFLLDSRQKGKSSLVARTILRLRDAGVRPVKLDLQRIGANVTPEQWYAGLAVGIGQELGFQTPVLDYWQRAQALGPMARFLGVIQEVILKDSAEQIVIFIDEIDFVRALDFSTDEFFGGIRECYNRRSSDEEFKRLSFCLVGVATPGQLIRNPDISPFNIGVQIDLTDFSLEETAPYSKSLAWDGRDANKLIERVHYWVAGHPYLTQLICGRIAEDRTLVTPSDLDKVVAKLFLSPEARQREPNLSDVERRLLSPDVPTLSMEEGRIQVLELYGQMLKSGGVEATGHNPVVATLRLSGVAAEQNGELRLRNRVYGAIFDEKWRQSVLPDAEIRRARLAQRRGALKVGAIAALIIASVSFLALKNMQLAEERNQAVVLANANEAKADREAYIRTLSLMDSDARNQRWLRVRQLLDKSSNSKYRGWEWEHWDLRLNGHRTEYRIPTEVGFVVASADGDTVISGNGYLAAIHNNLLTKLVQGPALYTGFSTKYLWLNRSGSNTQVFDSSTGQCLYTLPGGITHGNIQSPFLVWNHGNLLTLLKLTRMGATTVSALPSIPDFGFAYTSPTRWVLLADFRRGCTVIDRKLNRVNRFVDIVFESPKTCTFSSDERLAYLCSGERTVAVIDLEKAAVIRRLGYHNAPVQSVALNHDETRILTASHDGTSELLDLRSNQILRTFLGHDSGVLAAGFANNDRQVITGSQSGEIRFWDLNAPPSTWVIRDHKDQINAALLNYDAGRLVTTSGDGRCFVYDTSSRKRLLALSIGTMPLPGVLRLSHDTRYAIVGGEKGEVWCVDLMSATIRWKSAPCGSRITAASESTDGSRWVVGGYSGEAALLSANDGLIIAHRQIGISRITAASFSPDGSKTVFGSGNKLLICEPSTLGIVTTQEDNVHREVRSVEFASNSSIVVCRTSMPFILSFPDLKVIRELSGHTSRIFGATLSHSHKLIATHSYDGTARIFALDSEAAPVVMRHDSWLSTCEFSADDSRLLTSSDDFTTKIWSVETGEQITQLPGPRSPMFSANFSGDQSTVVTGAKDGTVTVFFTRRSLPWRRYVEAARK